MQIDMDVQSEVLGIVNAYNYWDEIAFPNWIAFNSLSTPRNALNLAYSLWHLLDWIRLDRRHALAGQDLGVVHAHFVQECPMLAVVHDIATFGKHAKVSRPKGSVAGASAEPLGAVLYFGPGGPRSEHPSKFTVTLGDGRELDLQDVFRVSIEYWDQYFKTPRTEPIANS
ncbi:MAG: hypothetical protein A3H44_11815 [Gammaproteobacteria bacterium RIFCSPLOWO2_02_FULL_57_10]|nr:MAG: hypothetical protein A3H44_11815 [Gammaproteobacteria bacterium RIFCSPLOWO2_02_FULL_57_10]